MHKLVSLAVQRGMTWNPVEKTVWKYLSEDDNRKLNACLSACLVPYTHIAIIKPRKQMSHRNVTLYSFIAANSGLWLVVPKQSWTFVDSWVPPDCLNYCNPRLQWSSWWAAVPTCGFLILVTFLIFPPRQRSTLACWIENVRRTTPASAVWFSLYRPLFSLSSESKCTFTVRRHEKMVLSGLLSGLKWPSITFIIDLMKLVNGKTLNPKHSLHTHIWAEQRGRQRHVHPHKIINEIKIIVKKDL